jgi:hypothetical protein
VVATVAGIRRTIGMAQVGKAPVLTADVRAMVDPSVAGSAVSVTGRCC